MNTTKSHGSAARKLVAAAVGATLALTLTACGGTSSAGDSNDTDRMAGRDSYPRIVITVDRGEISFARNPAKNLVKATHEAKNVLHKHRTNGVEVYSLPDRSQGIKTVNGNDWYKRNGENQYEVTVYGKDVEKKNGRIHLEAVSGWLDGRGWNQITTGGSSYRNELIVEPKISDGKVTGYQVQSTNKAGVGRGEFRFYDYSLDSFVTTNTSEWQPVLDTARFSEYGQTHTSIRRSETNPEVTKNLNWYWQFNPVLEARTETRDDGSQALIFRERWTNTTIREVNPG